MIIELRKIERKEIQTEADLERERMAHAPVLGKDAWYACAWYALWRLMTLHVFTPSGAWVIASTIMAIRRTESAFKAAPAEAGWWVVAAYVAHMALAWIYFCERHGARNLIGAMADLIRTFRKGGSGGVQAG